MIVYISSVASSFIVRLTNFIILFAIEDLFLVSCSSDVAHES